MARKKSGLGTVLFLGGAAAAGYMLYQKRELIRGFIDELVSAPGNADFTPYASDEYHAAPVPAETDIVIDRTGDDAPENPSDD